MNQLINDYINLTSRAFFVKYWQLEVSFLAIVLFVSILVSYLHNRKK